MKYFSFEELLHSDTARELGLDNTPTEEHRRNLEEMVDRLIDPLREAWEGECVRRSLGTPALYVSSGYRGPQLNKAVHGSVSSAHCMGWAVDLIAGNGQMLIFRDFCRTWLTDRLFDQMISEKERPDGTPVWIHIGYKNRQGAQRRQYLIYRDGGYKFMQRRCGIN